ncbi:CHASE2 domain-containing protein, partial [Burkholderia pseudomallei]
LAGVAGRMTASVDRIIYERLLTLRKLPIESNIVIFEIDNRSLDTLGRWPWLRSVHAEFLGALAKTHPAGVVYDVLFT